MRGAILFAVLSGAGLALAASPVDALVAGKAVERTQGGATVDSGTPVTLAQLQARIARPALLRGAFEQDKWVAGFRNPLRSAGSFVLVRGEGLRWTTERPAPSVLLVTARGIQARDARGRTLPLAQGPGGAAASRLLLALLSGDLAPLVRQFDADARALPGGAWRLRLVPRDAGTGKVFASLELHGDRYLRAATLREPNGDRTELRFSAQSSATSASGADRANLRD